MPLGVRRQNSMNRPSNDAVDLHKGYGKVPKYLQKFKNQREEEKKQREMDKEMAKCPPGTRRMPTPERLQILNDLNTTK